MKLQLKNTKKILLTLTFYFHKNVYIHLMLLFFINVFILIGLTGLLEALDQHVFSSDIILFIGLSLFLTVTEHLVKSSVSSQIYQLMMRSFGMGTVIIFIVTTMVYESLISDFIITSVEPLIGFSFIFIFLRFYMRQFIVFRMSSKKPRGIKR
jgi:hypothetical protein